LGTLFIQLESHSYTVVEVITNAEIGI